MKDKRRRLAKGIYAYNHMTRRHNGKMDCYFTVRFTVNGKQIEQGLGWASEGITLTRAMGTYAELVHNVKTGQGYITLQEKRDAEARRRQEEEERKRLEEAENTTFDELFNNYCLWFEAQDKKDMPSMKGRYTNHIKPFLGTKRLKSIAAIHIEQVKKAMKDKGLKPATVNHALCIIRQVFNWAIKRGLYDKQSPIKQVAFAKNDNKRFRFLSHEEAVSLLEELKQQSDRTHDMALLSLYTGLRAGEIMKLEKGHIDLVHDVIHVVDTKSKQNRQIPIVNDKIKAMLIGRASMTTNKLVFPSRTGGQSKEISNTFQRTADRLFNEGVTDTRQKVVFHSLRHTFASWLVIAGTPLYDVQMLLGHSDSNMTQRYAHLSPDAKKKAIASLPSLNELSKSKQPANVIALKQ